MNTGHSASACRALAFKELLAACIQPLLSGAVLSGPETQEKGLLPLVSYYTGHQLRIAAAPGSREFFTLRRAIPFREEERAFIEQVLLSVHGREEGRPIDQPLALDAVERAIAHAVNPDYADAVYQVLRIYDRWSRSENPGITHSTGIYFTRHKGPGGNFFTLQDQDYVRAVGASSDTLMAIGREGDILGVEKIAPAPTDNKKTQSLAAPITLADIALWASSRRKAAIRLTAEGEILIFKAGQLLFVKRGTYWSCYPHGLAEVGEMFVHECPALREDLRKAVYLTSLDLSFAGQCACIGIVVDRRALRSRVRITRPECLLSAKNPDGSAKLLAGIIRSKKFQELPRKIRVELCTVDGTLLIDADGNILSAGAGIGHNCETCGDRERNTAQAFACGGLGVSISEGGLVEVYGARHNAAQARQQV